MKKNDLNRITGNVLNRKHRIKLRTIWLEPWYQTSKQAPDNSIFGVQADRIRGFQCCTLASGKHRELLAGPVRLDNLFVAEEKLRSRPRILMVAERSWFNYGRLGWALKEFQPSGHLLFFPRGYVASSTWTWRSPSPKNLVSRTPFTLPSQCSRSRKL